jgi:hypothetical protein
MRETVGSLRAYFILSGLAGCFTAYRINLLNAGIGGASVEVITVVFGLTFVYVGFALASLLRSSANRIVTLLYVSAGWSVCAFILSIVGGASIFSVVTLVLSLLIVWYLLKNVRRLAAEVQAPPPTVP